LILEELDLDIVDVCAFVYVVEVLAFAGSARSAKVTDRQWLTDRRRYQPFR
jgi:hypothetical protein